MEPPTSLLKVFVYVFLLMCKHVDSFNKPLVIEGKKIAGFCPLQPIRVPMEEPLQGVSPERLVRTFIRQLLRVLSEMHCKGIVHLDMRPEAILIRDNKLILADFGNSRQLTNGIIAGEVSGSPEFVSPEMVRGLPLTLASDIWSVGTLTFMLLTGVSPFHGDNDTETLWNVSQGAYVMTDEEWSDFTEEARDFIRQIFQLHPLRRPTAGEALNHPWLSQFPEEEDEPLSTDCLREFKYSHKWLDRRVFVLQTPTEQELQNIMAPLTSLAEKAGASSFSLTSSERMEPLPPAPSETEEHEEKPRAQQLPPIRVPLDDFGRLVRLEDLLRIRHDEWGRPLDRENGPPIDFHGNPLPKLNKNLLRNIPPAIAEKLRESRECPPVIPPGSRKSLLPQPKGEAPATRASLPPPPPPQQQQLLSQVPLRMIRGERRQIEEEIANRILSDISEENSIAGSVASIEDIEEFLRPRQLPEEAVSIDSRSTTPHADSEGSTPTLTMMKNPLLSTESKPKFEMPPEEKKKLPVPVVTPSDDTYPYNTPVLTAAENDPSIPVGAPLFVEGLHHQSLVIDTAHAANRATLSPKTPSPRRCKPGTKSPITLSPGQEHSMEVVIALKRGKPSFLPPYLSAPELDDEDAKSKEKETKAKPSKHKPEFEDDSENRQTKRPAGDDLEKYRPKNFYREDEYQPSYDIDDSPWDSNYQIGPDTYLMATRGPAFNSRVRDYRRHLFGDGAPLVQQGFLGFRNSDISVRERRRYTDILREKASDGKEGEVNEEKTPTSIHRNPSTSAIERIKEDMKKVAPSATRKTEDGSFAPIFSSRLKDVPLIPGRSSVTFECRLVGQPTPQVSWSQDDFSISEDSRHEIRFERGISRLVIRQPTEADIGVYSCIASNEVGSDKSSARLQSGDPPTRPGRPDIQLSSDTELFITWDAPEGPPHIDGIVYRLEYRPVAEGDYGHPWVLISDQMDDEAVVLKHLEPLGIYQFRVRAKNSFGLGEPSLTSRIVRTHQKGAPKLQVDLLKTETRLTVVTMPQVKRGKTLEGISEESEECDTDIEKDEVAEEQSASVPLQNGDPRQRFQLEALVNKGRFAVIRNAVDTTTEVGAHCACVIRVDSEEARREVAVLAECSHENVCHIHAAYADNSLIFTICESLMEDVFARFTFLDYYTEELISMTARQMAAALHWIHFKGYAHLAISPHNIFFSSKRSWNLRVANFSHCKKLNETLPKEFNSFWAPPEFHLEEGRVTPQSDVWGIGVTIFCLLGGFHPFTSEYDSADEVKENVLKVKCDPNLIPVQASQEALSFVTWALKKSTLRRMRTDEALSHRFLSSDPCIVKRRQSIKYPSNRLRKTAFQTRRQKTDPLSESLKQAISFK